MIIYKDIFTGDEMFTDANKLRLVDDVAYEVYCKHVSRKFGETHLDGANPSQEEADEGTDDAVESGVDVVLNHRLQEARFFEDKKQYMGYIKDYMKNLADKLKQTKPDRVDGFKKGMSDYIKKILSRHKEFQFFTGESMDSTAGMVCLLEYRRNEDSGQDEPILIFFKDGLDEEKV